MSGVTVKPAGITMLVVATGGVVVVVVGVAGTAGVVAATVVVEKNVS
jgi:hypothetical protein